MAQRSTTTSCPLSRREHGFKRLGCSTVAVCTMTVSTDQNLSWDTPGTLGCSASALPTSGTRSFFVGGGRGCPHDLGRHAHLPWDKGYGGAAKGGTMWGCLNGRGQTTGLSCLAELSRTVSKVSIKYLLIKHLKINKPVLPLVFSITLSRFSLSRA